MSTIAIDLETTGIRPEDSEILEIGAVNVETGEIFQMLVKQEAPLSPVITELTHITDEMIADAESIETVMEAFDDFLGEGNHVLVGHNISFDFSFLQVTGMRLKKQGIFMENWFRHEIRTIDTLKISRKLHPELSSKSLGNMLAYYGLENEAAHRALSDARAAYELYEKLKEEGYDTRPELFEPVVSFYKEKKVSPATERQKKYLQDLLKYHKIEASFLFEQESISWDTMTKSQASRLIEKYKR